jgi:phosphoglycolate phosphatase-like HAD superfamily hydrolase
MDTRTRTIETDDAPWGLKVETRVPRARHEQGGLRRRAIVGLDCDGVLASDRLLWQQMRREFPQHIPARYEDLASFDWPRATAETTALCLELSADAAFMQQLVPVRGALEALGALRRLGYDVHIVTARPDGVRGATWRWLRRYGVAEYVEAIHCVTGGPAKPAVARALGCAAFVEDNAATAEALGAAGIRSYLMDAPYNRQPITHSLRLRGWSAVLADLKASVPAQFVLPAADTAQAAWPA